MATGRWAGLGLVGGVLAAAAGPGASFSVLRAPGLGAHGACTWFAVSVRTGLQ